MFNFWQAMSIEFQAELNALVQGTGWEEETAEFPLLVNLDDATLRLYRRVVGSEYIERLYDEWVTPTKTRKCWSIYLDRPEDTQQIRSDFDAIEAAYPLDFNIIGMWDWDGRPAGMQWVDPEDHSQGVTGTPTYGTPPQAINFMPDVKIPGDNYPDDPDDWVSVPATGMSDVHLLFGQEPRVFVDDDGLPWGEAVVQVDDDYIGTLFDDWKMQRARLRELRAVLDTELTETQRHLIQRQWLEMQDVLDVIEERLINRIKGE